VTDLPAERPPSDVARRLDEGEAVTAVLGSRALRVSWEPPRLQQVVSVLGNVVVDYRDADLPPGITALDCSVYLGNIEIHLPDDVHLELTGSVFLGNVETKGVQAPAEPGEERPLVSIDCSGWMGNIEVRLH
jgi:hypothetical protein